MDVVVFPPKKLVALSQNQNPPLITPWRRLLLRCTNLIEGQGGLAFESEGYVLFELRVNAALEVLRFNAEGPAGLIDRKAPGKVAKLNGDQRRALAARVERGSVPAVDGVVRWRLCDLVQWIFEDFGISLDETTVGRELRATSACQHPCAGAAHER